MRSEVRPLNAAKQRCAIDFQNTFQFVGTVAPAEVMRYRQTGAVRYLARAKRYLLDVYDVYHTLKTYQEAEHIAIRNADFPTLGWMFEPEPYISAYNGIKDVAAFTEEEIIIDETVVERAMRPIERMPRGIDEPEYAACPQPSGRRFILSQKMGSSQVAEDGAPYRR